MKGRVLSNVYAGTHSRYKVLVNEYEIQVVTEPQAIRRYANGDEVTLRFPPQRIWVIPKDAKESETQPEA